MNRFFILCSLFAIVATAAMTGADHWIFKRSFVLKKDQLQRIELKTPKHTFRLAFRWTLFTDGGLVMHVYYEKHHEQPMLFLDRRRDAFRIDLFAKPANATPLQYIRPYAILRFVRFDTRKHVAVIELRVNSSRTCEVAIPKGA
jgi:hypothetical protein